jgi:hypothetical protein
MTPADITAKVIRPLVWGRVSTYAGFVWDAKGYRIGQWNPPVWQVNSISGESFPTLAAAKAEAEADYVARIAADLRLDAVVALVEAVKVLRAIAVEEIDGLEQCKEILDLDTALAAFTPNTEPKS